jgi:hypothetical protein
MGADVIEITREAGGYACKFGYDAGLVAALKAAVPGRWRRWDPERRVWLFSVRGWPLAERVFTEYGLLEGVAGPDWAWRALHLQPGAPESVIKAVYRTLAHTTHPDKGGDTEAMKRLNLAYERLRGTA